MQTSSKRIDHLGIIAGVIRELDLVKLIDNLIPCDPREEISTGEATSGMIINGLGLSGRSMTLTPQFFESKVMSVGALIQPVFKSHPYHYHQRNNIITKLVECICKLSNLVLMRLNFFIFKKDLSITFLCL